MADTTISNTKLMSRSNLILLVLQCLFMLHTVYAETEYSFTRIGLEQGLKTEYIWSITEDRKGRFWLGGINGLDGFDGKQVLDANQFIDEHSQKVPSSGINASFIDSDGALWLGLQKQVMILNPDSNQFRVFRDFSHNDDILSSHFQYFHELPNKHVLATSAGSVYLQHKNNLTSQLLIDRSNTSSVIGIISEINRIGIMFSDWQLVWLSSTGEVTETHLIPKPAPYLEATLTLQYTKGLLLAATEKGIYYYEMNSGNVPVIISGSEHLTSILTMKKNPKGLMLIGTQSGLYEASWEANSFKSQKIRVTDGETHAQYIYTIQFTSDDSLLLGTERGLFIGKPPSKAITNIDMRRYQDAPDTITIAQDAEQQIWLATKTLSLFDRNLTHKEVPDSLKSLPPVNHILSTDKGLWFSHRSGLTFFSINSANALSIPLAGEKLSCPEDAMISVYHGMELQQSNSLAFAVRGGIIKIMPDTMQLSYFPLGSGCKPYAGLAVDSQHNVYTSRASEIWQLTPEGNTQFHHVPNHPYMFLFNTQNPHEDTLFVTTGTGISSWDPVSAKLHPIDTDSGNWLSLLETDEYYWAATLQNGLHRVNKQTLKSRIYTQLDGLLNYKYNLNAAIVTSDGRLAFAGENGVDIVKPDLMPDHEQIEVSISAIKYDSDNNRQVVLPLLSQLVEDLIAVPATASNIEIWLTSPNQQYGGKYAIAYRIRGLSQSWQQIPESVSKFTISYLPVGEYHIDLQIKSPSGATVQQDSSVRLRVTEPSWFWWYQQAFESIADFANIWVTLYKTASPATILIYLLVDVIVILVIIFWVWYAGKKKQQKLQQEIKRKTAEISRQHEELEKLLHYRQDLLASVAHELKTPLTLMLGVMSGQHNPNDRDKKFKRLIFRISHLLDNMMTLAKKAQDSQENQPHNCYQAAEFVEFYITTYRGFVPENRIRLTENAPAIVCCAADTLDKIITNLVNNAIKYSPADSEIVIRASISGKTWQFEIENQGPGISPDKLKSVFERYVRISDANESFGLGLGLPLVKQLVDTCGGEISITSAPHQLTQIRLTLPLATDAQIAASPLRGVEYDELSEDYRNWLYAEMNQPKVVPKQTILTLDSESERSLVFCIDDNEELLEQLQEQLGQRFSLVCFTHAREALSQAEQDLPDLIVSDVMMPEMTGFDVVTEIRKNELISHIPVILLTAKNDAKSKIIGLQAMADDFIAKPYEALQLAAKIDNLIAIRHLLKTRFSVALPEAETDTTVSHLSVLFSECAPDQRRFMQKVIDCLQEHINEPEFSIKELGHALHLSDSQVRRKVKAISGYSPQEVMRIIRLEAAASMIKEGRSLKVIAHECGFSSQSHMGSAFKAYFGQTPNQYRTQYYV